MNTKLHASHIARYASRRDVSAFVAEFPPEVEPSHLAGQKRLLEANASVSSRFASCYKVFSPERGPLTASETARCSGTPRPPVIRRLLVLTLVFAASVALPGPARGQYYRACWDYVVSDPSATNGVARSMTILNGALGSSPGVRTILVPPNQAQLVIEVVDSCCSNAISQCAPKIFVSLNTNVCVDEEVGDYYIGIPTENDLYDSGARGRWALPDYLMAAGNYNYALYFGDDQGWTGPNPCPFTFSVRATYYPKLPTISTQPQSLSVVQGKPASFAVVAQGEGLTYQWWRRPTGGATSTSISGATGPTYSVLSASAADAADYRVVVSNSGGSTNSAWATLTVISSPVILSQPQSQSVSVGQDATFTATASGTPPLNYQWRLNGTNISGATTNSYSRTNVQPTDAGDYSVVVTNSAGSVISSNATLAVILRPTILAGPQSRTNCAGSPAAFAVAAFGAQPLTYHWRKNGVGLNDGGNVSGSTTAALNLPNVQPTDAGSYDVMVTNDAGTVTSSAATLTVLTSSVPNFLISQPGTVLRFDGCTGGFIDKFVYTNSGGLTQPQGMAIGPDGNLYVVDSWHVTVKKYNGVTGVFMGDFVPGGILGSPITLKFGPDGTLYVLDNNPFGRILKFDSTGAYLGVAANGIGAPGEGYDFVFLPGSTNNGLDVLIVYGTAYAARYDAQTGNFLSYFLNPTGNETILKDAISLAIGPDGALWVVDSGHTNLARFNSSTGAKIDNFVSGQGSDWEMLLANGTLYLANYSGNSVLRFNAATGLAIPGPFISAPAGGLQSPTYMTFQARTFDGGLAAGFGGVNAAFAMTQLQPLEGQNVRLTFQTVPGQFYRLLSKDRLDASVPWTLILSNIVAIGTTTQVTAPTPVGPQRFYRVELIQ